ncbi:hypothetical protein EI94DRAFT_1734101 [Lactarius quietus]|nr:hypothetical protein EI94DRAFT_1734101 [Lactarius quietus]
MDASEIAMEERVKVDDRVASAMLHDSTSNNTRPPTQKLSGTELDIFTAARLGKTEHIRALIESDRARPTDRDEDDLAALHWAAISGRTETCEYLIEHGADINALTNTLHATALQWAALQGLPQIVHLLIEHGADARLLDAQGYSTLHAATHSSSSSFWCVLLLLCQAGLSPDVRDAKGRTALHWAARQCDEVSMRVLLRWARTRMLWTAMDAPHCIGQLSRELALRWVTCRWGCGTLEKDAERRTARDVADEFGNRDVWDRALTEAGRREDGSEVRRPLSEPHLKIIVFSVPSISLCIAFVVTSVFPWYMSIILAPAALVAMHLVVLFDFLQRRPVSDSIYSSPYFLGIICGSGLWISYAWATRLRHAAHFNPYTHALLALLFGLCVVALVLTIVCDPGTIIIEDLIRRKQLTTRAFCVQCLVARPPHSRHCSRCNKCVTHHECMDLNHAYFIIFMATFTACVLTFDYLVWIYLATLKETPPPRRFCVLPHEVCRLVSGDMFLSSVAAWSSFQLMWSGMVAVNYGDVAWRICRRRVKGFFESADLST